MITFCGISSHGNPATGNGELTTTAEFAVPGGSGSCSGLFAGGATDNGTNQWDGLVGRLTRAHSAAAGGGLETLQFLSIVGGAEQDGLFGIAETDDDRFVVVGSTANGAQSGSSGLLFPINNGTCIAGLQQYCLGVVAAFDASGTPLALEYSRVFGTGGTTGAERNTVARDVLVQRGLDSQTPADLVVIVGSTDDDDLLIGNASQGMWGVDNPGPDTTRNGIDGFVIWGNWTPASGIWYSGGTFHGGSADEELTGVQGWNEFSDCFAVVGTNSSGYHGGPDIELGSYFRLPGILPSGLGALTAGQLGGSNSERPTAMGLLNATSSTVPWNTFTLGDPAGGGIAVDQQARTTIVGTTVSTNYPFVGGLTKQSPGFDAVRTAVDLLPVGTGRTDGTGPTAATTGPFPLPGFTGGTTPFCALTTYGNRIGRPAPVLPRMQIDFLGVPAGSSTNTAIVVSRPTPGGWGNLLGLQYGFPNGPTSPPYLGYDGLEGWITDPTSVVYSVAVVADTPLVFSLTSPLPPGPVIFSVQLACLMPGSTIPGGNASVSPQCPTTIWTTATASPALWVSY
ncbi:MAG: hypothetical protein KDC98_06595 [Planctomycetes bacterium]|nr:hypothetical protein [Planctomycetota bacterium]